MTFPALLGRALTLGALSAATLLSAPGAAQAAACDQQVYYTITDNSSKFLGFPLPTFKDGPGGTMTASVDTSASVSASITGATEAEAGAIIAKAKVSVSATLSTTVSVSVGHKYSHDIAKNKYGHLQYGTYGQHVAWTKKQTLSSCTVKTLKSGSGNIPSTELGWKFWETAS